jgi:hypothetical protein
VARKLFVKFMHPVVEGATSTAMFKLAYTTEFAQNKEEMDVLTGISICKTK